MESEVELVPIDLYSVGCSKGITARWADLSRNSAIYAFLGDRPYSDMNSFFLSKALFGCEFVLSFESSFFGKFFLSKVSATNCPDVVCSNRVHARFLPNYCQHPQKSYQNPRALQAEVHTLGVHPLNRLSLGC